MAASNKSVPPRPTALAHDLAARVLSPGDLAIDATCGNGHDTVQLARLVGPRGSVVAIDVQADALAETRHRLEAEGMADNRVRFIHGCHTTIGGHVAPATAALAMFNLGYLPGGDRALTTDASTTSAALDAAAHALRPGGLLLVTCYSGHPEGAHEAETVATWMKSAASRGARVAHYAQPFTLKPAPLLWLAAI